VLVFGQVNETLGTFYFDGQPVVARETRWILNPNRSVPSATLEAKVLYTKFPEMIEIRKWKIVPGERRGMFSSYSKATFTN